jgi:hypothetical protein
MIPHKECSYVYKTYNEWDISYNKCVVADPFIRLWALDPTTRRPNAVKGITDAPPFEYVTGNFEEPIKITREYCEKFMKVSFDSQKRECFIGRRQFLAETFMGTMYRELI